MLPRLSILMRLLLLLAVPLAALLIVSLAGLSSINASGATTIDMQRRLEQQASLEDLRESINSTSQSLAAFASGQLDNKLVVEAVNAARARIETAGASYLKAARGAALRQAESEFKPALDAVSAALARIQDNVMDNDLSAVRAAVAGELATTSARALEQVTTLLNSEREATALLIRASLERGKSFFILNTVLGFSGLGLALLFGYFIGRSITEPVQQITHTVQSVAAGNLDARVRMNSYDEIGVLGNALDKLLDEKVTTLARAEQDNVQLNDSVIVLLRAVSRLSQRDLTVRVPVTEDVTGPVADAINQLASETGRVLAEVSRVAAQVATASAQVKSQAESVNAAAHDQQSEAVDTADKLNHASERLSEIAKLAQHCNELARSAAQSTESAVLTVTGTLRGMTDIREVIQETGKRIKRLGERSQEISGIVDIINKIAERTTVLALNASMQAAAAGDAGRGFGVVADEVQRLAESTRNAAGQIGTLIKSMQIETNDTIGTMENAIGQVVEGSKMAEAAGKQIGDTQGATTALVQSVRQIAASSEEQAQLSVTLRDRAHTMISGGRTTGAQLTQQVEETIHLTDFARLLVDSVRVFKLPA
ncbi:MAG: HAMP domain-containing protein [Candidatus Obscuribacterales bacterium]|nr:HAMP domain-containing protein [Steroidobacteraceae bacterium]